MLTALAVVCFLLATAPAVQAHSMEIEPLEDQRVKVVYEGGGFSRRTTVTVLDDMGRVLEEGKLDAEGVYDYSHLSQAHKILADDGIGHRAEWVIGTDHYHQPKMPVIAGVWMVFGSIAWYFDRKVDRTKRD